MNSWSLSRCIIFLPAVSGLLHSLTPLHGKKLISPRIANVAASQRHAVCRMSSSTTELVSAPASFGQAISCAQTAAANAFADGKRLVEIEFPPLPADMLEAPECSAYDVSNANIRLAIDFAKKFTTNGTKVAILLPDNAEVERAIEQQGGYREPFPGVIIDSITQQVGDASSIGEFFGGIFGKQGNREVKVMEEVDMYIMCIFSAQELPDCEALALAEPTKKMVYFNLKLDTQRGDLGLPAFPPKDLQYRFLSQILPVYYLRTRAYSKSIAQPPFIVNYQGALFRAYPGGYQSLLDIGKGRYKRVELADERPALGDFKNQLSEALNLGDDGKVQSFFRQGYKTSTWWEDAKEEELHKTWRS
eukprot:CAMPEP_0185770410 /NCGR_PEP_ID=MMETSP1174-20130828/59018_1 /TAXON_ID=35687 /ORGANISM="Dictyocha speculum, Strain CCMP1381" /LENGTH=360 /DNA_ID=CAMNT_0028455833 /DNA_START=37 /DNA_END=1119 /DNA_ORIENTATION=+